MVQLQLDFMKHYGYLAPDKDTSAALYSEEGLSSVIKEIQRFGAIPQTGKLDNATVQVCIYYILSTYCVLIFIS